MKKTITKSVNTMRLKVAVALVLMFVVTSTQGLASWTQTYHQQHRAEQSSGRRTRMIIPFSSKKVKRILRHHEDEAQEIRNESRIRLCRNHGSKHLYNDKKENDQLTPYCSNRKDIHSTSKARLGDDTAQFLVSLALAGSCFLSCLSWPGPAMADSSSFEQQGGSSSNIASSKSYDGFAEYAKDNQMEQSDVSCFVNQCGQQTKSLFSNPRGIKGVVCLGQCKGEQSCATRCFAEYGSDSLNNWLSCTIEENECVKVPKTNIDNSDEDVVGYKSVIQNFDPSTLVGTWYKTDGLNPNYDLFDCQTNTFKLPTTPGSLKNNPRELDMDIFFRVQRPGGGFWENALTEHMVVDNNNNRDDAIPKRQQPLDTGTQPLPPTMHTAGKMYGLQFSENWFILGESDGKGSIPPFKLVAYKGHTLQGNYEGAFVYAKESILPEAARSAVREAALKAGLDFDQFTRIDNTCPIGEALNDADSGTGTSATDWINLVVGEGGIIDWITPGWRGEYQKSS